MVSVMVRVMITVSVAVRVSPVNSQSGCCRHIGLPTILKWPGPSRNWPMPMSQIR